MQSKYELTKVIGGPCGIILGSLTAGMTAIGPAVDTLGFRDVMAILTVGTAVGTTGNNVDIYMRLQEADIIGTSANYADITDGSFTGTCQSTTLALVAGTVGARYNTGSVSFTKMYERLNDGVRKRYIRAVATCKGSGLEVQVPYAVTLILGMAEDTEQYISQATTVGSGHEGVTTGWSICLGTALE